MKMKNLKLMSMTRKRAIFLFGNQGNVVGNTGYKANLLLSNPISS